MNRGGSQGGTADRARFAAKIALVAAAYYGAAKVGLSLAFATSSVTAVWPPTGIALAALVLWGPTMWPGVALGAFLANAWTGVPLGAVLGITTGNTLEAVVGALLLRRSSFNPSLTRVRDVLALVVWAALLSTAIAATIGVSSLIAADEVQARDFWPVWRVWWLGDMGGDLLVATVIMVAVTHWPFKQAPGRAPEALLLGAAVIGFSVAIFQNETNLAYLVFPLLIWAVLRFWQPGATLATLTIAATAVAFTANDVGPFVRGNPDDSLLLAQTFFGVTGITVLVLAAVVTERREAERISEDIARTLQEGLLPARVPHIPSVDVAARFRAAGESYSVGGDFYDVFETSAGSWAIVVGDVAGKGPEAAVVTALARYTVRATALQERQPSRILTLLNEALRRQRPEDEFCTVVYAELALDPEGKRAEVTLCSGGHPLPQLLRADGTVRTLGRHGLAIGIDAEPDLVDDVYEIRGGDALVFHTDGLTDAYAPARPLESAELVALLEGFSGCSAEQIAAGLYETATSLAHGEPRDDIAIVVIRLTP